MMKGESVMTGAEHPGTLPEVMQSPAGWYIGFRDEHGMPYSRETNYFGDQASAELVLSSFRMPADRPSFKEYQEQMRKLLHQRDPDRCRLCGESLEDVMPDLAKEGYCAECWIP